MDRFFAGNYAIMRHARDTEHDNKVAITEDGAEVCRRVSKRLAKQVASKKVVIFHSPKVRAELTAGIIRDTLTSEGVSVASVEPIKWLDCDYPDVTEENVRRIVPQNPGEFAVLVTHLPQVAEYLGMNPDGPGPRNCDLFSREFRIFGAAA